MIFFQRSSLFLFLMCVCLSTKGQNVKNSSEIKKTRIPAGIAPYFLVPGEFRESEKYRSPLTFYDGSAVKTTADWTRRRKEILDKWHGMMGEWPPFIKDQEMEILDTLQQDGFTQHRVKFRWTPLEETHGYLSIPDGPGEKPAVITVFYEPETAIGKGIAGRDFALQLTKRGFITLSIGTTEASKALTYSIYYPSIENATVQPLSMLGYAAANSWYVLSKVPGVDSTKIGIMGHSFGGKWAMFASTLFDKFACAVWSDPGIVFDEARPNVNYWEPWYLGYHPKPWRKRGIITEDNPVKGGPYSGMVKNGHDLHELHALMAPRPFLVSGGSEDPLSRWEALSYSVDVNRLLGYQNRVAMTNRPEHSPNVRSNEQAFQFLEYFLKSNDSD